MIGQLPVEAGGNYTTGAAKVVYELTKQNINGVQLFTFATNATEKAARATSQYAHQYIGYRKWVPSIFSDWILHPLRTAKEWRHYRRSDHENPFRYAFYKANIQRAVRLIKPDIIHVHSIGNVSPTRFAIQQRHIPLLLTCHGIFYRGDADDTIGRDRYEGNLPLCDYFTGLTEEARKEFTDILKVPVEKFTIIPNGVDTTKFYYSEEWRMKIREECGADDHTIVFATVASLQERKGQLAFVKILEQLEGLDWQYWLIGLGPEQQQIEEFAREHHLSDRVRLLGYCNSDELFRYYSAADVYAHSSWKEGQALSEIEAFTTGLPAVVNKAIAGTLVSNPSDTEQYYLLDFSDFSKESLKSWLQSRPRDRASRGNYDWQQILNQYATVYHKLLNM